MPARTVSRLSSLAARFMAVHTMGGEGEREGGEGEGEGGEGEREGGEGERGRTEIGLSSTRKDQKLHC